MRIEHFEIDEREKNDMENGANDNFVFPDCTV